MWINAVSTEFPIFCTHSVQALGLWLQQTSESLEQGSLPIDQSQNCSKMRVFCSDLLSSYLKSCLRVVSCQSPIREGYKPREAIMIVVPGTPRNWINGPASFFEQEFPSGSSSWSSWSQYTSQCPRMAHRFVCVEVITSPAAEPCRNPLLSGRVRIILLCRKVVA